MTKSTEKGGVFNLKDGDKAVFRVQIGLKYMVEETDAYSKQGFTPDKNADKDYADMTSTVSWTDSNNEPVYRRTSEVTVDGPGVYYMHFVNCYKKQAKLNIKKHVTGITNSDILQKEFIFTLQKLDSETNTYVDVKDGSFNLKDNETKSFMVGSGKYRVIESDPYTTDFAPDEEQDKLANESDGTTTTLDFNNKLYSKEIEIDLQEDEGIDSVESTDSNIAGIIQFYNYSKALYELPSTGGMGTYLFFLLGAFLMTVAFGMLVMRLRKH